MNKKEQIKTMRTIKMISGIVEKSRQKTIKRIEKKLQRMSANDLSTLERILK